jgi:hypothetical protein
MLRRAEERCEQAINRLSANVARDGVPRRSPGCQGDCGWGIAASSTSGGLLATSTLIGKEGDCLVLGLATFPLKGEGASD